MFAACAEVEDEQQKKRNQVWCNIWENGSFWGNGVTYYGASFDLKSCNAGLLL